MSTRRPQRRPPPAPVVEARDPVVFRSGRAATLHWVTLVAALPTALTVVLLARPMPPGQGWEASPLGPALWWVIPTLLCGLALALPGAMVLLHDRYVLRLERTEAASWRLTTWLLWGRRVREVPTDALTGAQSRYEDGRFRSRRGVDVDAPYLKVQLASGKRLIFDVQAEASNSRAALEALFAVLLLVGLACRGGGVPQSYEPVAVSSSRIDGVLVLNQLESPVCHAIR